MAGDKTVETTGLLGWIDKRFPLTSLYKDHMSEYYAPKNFNFWYFFGWLAIEKFPPLKFKKLCFVMQAKSAHIKQLH